MTNLFFLSMLMMSTTWMLMVSNNPMNLSLTIMVLAITTSLMSYMASSSWYALILFLIYIGGMMVTFSYFVSLCSNDSMMLKTKIHLMLLPIIFTKSTDLKIITPPYSYSQLNKPYFMNNILILLMITMILMLVMIIAIKMVKFYNSPLRRFNSTS